MEQLSKREQEIIAKINWQRIYTTNYDNVFELACEKTKKRIQSVILSDRPNDYKNKSNGMVPQKGTQEHRLPGKSPGRPGVVIQVVLL